MYNFIEKCKFLDSIGHSKELDDIDSQLVKLAQGVIKKPVSVESRMNLLEQKVKKMEQALGGMGGEIDQVPQMIQKAVPNPNIIPEVQEEPEQEVL